MTKRLQQAFEEASRLPEQDQDRVAAWLLSELASESRWDELFARSHNQLERLAGEALAEHHRGETRQLDADAVTVAKHVNDRSV